MKRILILSALLLTMAAPAHAQLNIRKTSDKPKQEATLTAQWNWLYTLDGRWYFVTKTTNQFDGNIWIELGDDGESALASINQLIDLAETIGEDEGFELTDKSGEDLRLTLYKAMGKRYGFQVTGTKYAGVGYIYLPSLKKAVQTIQKERTMQDLERRKKEQQNK